MEIKVLGSGCQACSGLEQTVFDVLAELDIVADVEPVKDAERIRGIGVASLPALVINGNIKVSGRVPHKEEIKRWLQAEGK